MSVPEVVAAYEALGPVVKHFELSTKSREKLDEAISFWISRDMTKEQRCVSKGTEMYSGQNKDASEFMHKRLCLLALKIRLSLLVLMNLYSETMDFTGYLWI